VSEIGKRERDERPEGSSRAGADAAISRSRDRRREAAKIARTRRLALSDVVIGATIGLVLVVIGLGLAPVGIAGALLLIVCGGSYAFSRIRRRNSRA
jgi:hypothetical protein